MILRFITKRNVNGHRKYLAINTENKMFCRMSPRMIPDGDEIPAKALANIQMTAENDGYKETEAF